MLNDNFNISHCFEFKALSYVRPTPLLKKDFMGKEKIGLQLERNK